MEIFHNVYFERLQKSINPITPILSAIFLFSATHILCSPLHFATLAPHYNSIDEKRGNLAISSSKTYQNDELI